MPQTSTDASTLDKNSDAARQAVPLAHQAIHDVVVQILSTLETRGALLDVPAGEGALAARLKKIGFEVRCCDLYPQIFRLPDVEIKRGDLSASLPYNDRTFDVITCIEGVEHIENPQQAMREFARLIKPNGTLIVSTPNIQNIEERFKWLLYGYTSHFKPLSREHLADERARFPEMEEIALHINPISYAEMRYALEKCGFEIARVHRDKLKKNQWAYFPAVALIKLLTLLTSAPKRRLRWANELQSNEVLRGGNTLIFEAVKSL